MTTIPISKLANFYAGSMTCASTGVGSIPLLNTDMGKIAESIYTQLPSLILQIVCDAYNAEICSYELLRALAHVEIAKYTSEEINRYFFPTKNSIPERSLIQIKHHLRIQEELLASLTKEIDRILPWIVRYRLAGFPGEEVVFNRREFLLEAWARFGKPFLVSEHFGIHGIPDYLVKVDDIGLTVKELKFTSYPPSRGARKREKFQTYAYAILVKDALQMEVRFAKIVYLSINREALLEVPEDFPDVLNRTIKAYRNTKKYSS